MFLLALVKEGLITPYDWQAKGRVSLGASLQAARRLVDGDLLVKKVSKDPRSRGRHEFGLTDKGWDELDELDRYLRDALNTSLTDFESVLRLACLATINGDSTLAKEFLSEAIDEHRQRARAAKRRHIPPKSKLGHLYSALLRRWEEEERTAMAQRLELLRRRWTKITEWINRFDDER